MANEISERLFDQARKLEDLGKYKEAADLYLQAALDLIKQNEIDQAVKNLMLAARTYEKDQDWRKIGALWDSIGEHIRSQLGQESLDSTTIDSLFQQKVIGVTKWENQRDLNHKRNEESVQEFRNHSFIGVIHKKVGPF